MNVFALSDTAQIIRCNAYLHAPVASEPVGGADLSELAGEIPEKLRQVFLPFVPTLKKGKNTD